METLVLESAAIFAKPETPETWEAIDAQLARWEAFFTSIGFVADDSERRAIMSTTRTLQPTVLRSIQSDRSKLSATACAYVRSLALVLGRDFDLVAEPYFENMVNICGRANRLFGKRAEEALDGALRAATPPNSITIFVPHLSSKNKAVREAVMACIVTLLREGDAALLEPHAPQFEAALKQGIQDSSPQARDAAKQLFAVLRDKWPERAQLLLASVDARTRKLLEGADSKPSDNRPAPPRRAFSAAAVGFGRAQSADALPPPSEDDASVAISAPPLRRSNTAAAAIMSEAAAAAAAAPPAPLRRSVTASDEAAQPPPLPPSAVSGGPLRRSVTTQEDAGRPPAPSGAGVRRSNSGGSAFAGAMPLRAPPPSASSAAQPAAAPAPGATSLPAQAAGGLSRSRSSSSSSLSDQAPPSASKASVDAFLRGLRATEWSERVAAVDTLRVAIKGGQLPELDAVRSATDQTAWPASAKKLMSSLPDALADKHFKVAAAVIALITELVQSHAALLQPSLHVLVPKVLLTSINMNNRLVADAGNELIRALLDAPWPGALMAACTRAFGIPEFVPNIKLQGMLVTLSADVIRYHGDSCGIDLSTYARQASAHCAKLLDDKKADHATLRAAAEIFAGYTPPAAAS